jgi:hypothetical protein
MIHKVNKGSGGKSTTYSVWGKYHTEFSGAQGKAGDRTIKIQGNLFNGLTYPRRVELRRFVAEEIQRVPVQTKKGKQYPDLVQDVKGYELTEPDSPVLRPRETAVKAQVKPKQKPSKKKPAEDEFEVEKFVCRPRAGIIKVLWTAGDTTEETVKQLKRDLDSKTYNRLVRDLKTCP